MSLLLKNAVESIQIGVEDFGATESKRYLSAVRNIYAGILLLYKHQLSKMSPPGSKDVFLKRQVVPEFSKDGEIVFVGSGKNTVDVREIRSRFKGLKVDVDWRRLEKIQKIRNAVEHYYTEHGAEVIKKELFSHAFVLINDFICRYVAESPADVLGEGYWKVLLENNEIFEGAKKRCLESLAMVDWKYPSFQKILPRLRCSKCNSPLVKTTETGTYCNEMRLICEEGGHEFILEDVLESAIDDAFWAENYIAAKDGGEPAVEVCPFCQSEAYILDDDVCLSCEETRAYTSCFRCGAGLSLDEQQLSGLCGYCSHLVYKED